MPGIENSKFEAQLWTGEYQTFDSMVGSWAGRISVQWEEEGGDLTMLFLFYDSSVLEESTVLYSTS